MLDPSLASPSLFASDPVQQTTRPATEAERTYLRGVNRLRVLRYVMFMGNVVAIGGVVGCLLWIAVGLFIDGTLIPSLLVCVLTLALVVGVSFAWGRPVLAFLRMPPMLCIPKDLRVLCFYDTVLTVNHATRPYLNIFALRARRSQIEIPSHWERHIITDRRLSGQAERCEVASLPGASGQVLRLPLRSKYGHQRIDPTFSDLGDFVLRLGDLSIAEEMKAGLPVVRAQEPLMIFGMALGVVGLFASLVCWILISDLTQQVEAHENRIARITERYHRGEAVPMAALEARGLRGLAPDPEFGERVVHAAPVSFHKVSLSDAGAPFYLSDSEIAAMTEISSVFPLTLPGLDPIAPTAIAGYRAQLMQKAEALAAQAPQAHWLRKTIEALPDTQIAQQMRALPYTNAADPAFVSAVQPVPVIYAGSGVASPYAYKRPHCSVGTLLCGQNDAIESEDAPIFVLQRQQILMQDGSDLASLAEARARVADLKVLAWPDRAIAVCALLVLVSVGVGGLWALANLRLRRWYRGRAVGGRQG
jgi:hypothetical protein